MPRCAQIRCRQRRRMVFSIFRKETRKKATAPLDALQPDEIAQAALANIRAEASEDAKARLVTLLQGASAFYVPDAEDAPNIKDTPRSRAAVLFIEFKNEISTDGGILHPQAKDVIVQSGMLGKAVEVVEACRSAGVKVLHTAITLSEDVSDVPNRALGILTVGIPRRATG